MHSRHGWSFPVALVTVVVFASPVWGQELDVQSMQDVGIALRRQNQPEAALRVFQLAYDLRHEASTLARIAQAEMALNRFADAEEHLQRVLADGRDRWVQEHLTQVRAALEQTSASLGSLEIQCNVAGAELWVDGARYRTLSFQRGPQVVRLQVGRRRLEVRAEGYIPDERSADIPVGIEVGARLIVGLVRTPESLRAEAHRTATATASPGPWVLAALGVAGIGTFAVFQFVLREDAIGSYQERCPNGVCSPANYPSARDALDEAGQYGAMASISLGAGAVALGGAALWALLARPSMGSGELRSSLFVRPTSCATGTCLLLEGRF
jgi:tetratricopeptide (TPR) repeat protein